MNSSEKKGKKKVTIEDIQNAATVEEAQELMEEYYNSRPMITYNQWFFGYDQKVERNRQEGKPPYY